eukprot:9965386-Alexandrium_andersonii.AAC.1
MSASLVGSEMCIRDRLCMDNCGCAWLAASGCLVVVAWLVGGRGVGHWVAIGWPLSGHWVAIG